MIEGTCDPERFPIEGEQLSEREDRRETRSRKTNNAFWGEDMGRGREELVKDQSEGQPDLVTENADSDHKNILFLYYKKYYD